jgi:hypothetical protein
MSKDIQLKNNLELKLCFKLLNEVDHEQFNGIDFGYIRKLKTLMSFAELKTLYSQTVQVLNQRNKAATAKTLYEFRCKKIISHYSNTEVITSFWIGRSNFDLFLPYVAGSGKSRMKGLVIEVNGAVHDIELKMKKDNGKADMLKALGIGVLSVGNKDLSEENLKKVFSEINSFPRIDFRAKCRLLSTIYSHTILANSRISNELVSNAWSRS